jgi:hypothetical protein
VKVFWAYSDVIIALTAVPHVLSLVWIALKKDIPYLAAQPAKEMAQPVVAN